MTTINTAKVLTIAVLLIVPAAAAMAEQQDIGAPLNGQLTPTLHQKFSSPHGTSVANPYNNYDNTNYNRTDPTGQTAMQSTNHYIPQASAGQR